MGITEDRFWEMNPAMLKPYQKAEEIKTENNNYGAWLQGLYVFEALQSAMSGLSGKKSKIKPYPKEPFPVTAKRSEEAEKQKQERMKHQWETFVQGLKNVRQSS